MYRNNIHLPCVSLPVQVGFVLTDRLWVVVGDDKYEEVYENFEKSIERLPKKDVDTFLRDRILSFIKSI